MVLLILLTSCITRSLNQVENISVCSSFDESLCSVRAGSFISVNVLSNTALVECGIVDMTVALKPCGSSTIRIPHYIEVLRFSVLPAQIHDSLAGLINLNAIMICASKRVFHIIMAVLVLLHEVIHNALCHREIAVTALVVIQHSGSLFHVEVRLYRHLGTAIAIVIVHLEVDQHLPVSISRAISLQGVRAITIVLEELIELGPLIVSGTHLQISLRILLATLGEVPILIGHIVGGLILNHSASVLVVLGFDELLVLHIGVVLGLCRKTHSCVL